jgi:hypothetical protein
MLCAFFGVLFELLTFGDFEGREFDVARSLGENSGCSELLECSWMLGTRLRVEYRIPALLGLWLLSLALIALIGVGCCICGDMPKFSKGRGGPLTKLISRGGSHILSSSVEISVQVLPKSFESEKQA